MAVNQDEFRKALGHFATGVTIVTVPNGAGQVHGMTANAFSSVSLAPPLVLVCVEQSNRTLPLLLEHQKFGVSVLRDDQQAVSSHYADPDRGPVPDGSLEIRFRHTQSGIPLLQPALVQLACRVAALHEAGDHTIFIGEVEELAAGQGQPLLFYAGKYRRLQAEPA